MTINKNNYEAFFLDYHEGNLTPQEVADLFLFIAEHPELKEEFENFENITLDDISIVPFGDKSGLKKKITIENKEEYFIRSVENTLNTTETALLNGFLKRHPHFLTEFEMFQKTKLFADSSVFFENKQELKKSVSLVSEENNVLKKGEEVDTMLISAVEGLLSVKETKLLYERLKMDTQIKKDYLLFQKARLVADPFVVYANKEELKHKNKKVIPFYYYVAAAASVALLLGLFFLMNNSTVDQKLAVSKPLIENELVKQSETALVYEKKTDGKKEQLLIPIASVSKNNTHNELVLFHEPHPRPLSDLIRPSGTFSKGEGKRKQFLGEGSDGLKYIGKWNKNKKLKNKKVVEETQIATVLEIKPSLVIITNNDKKQVETTTTELTIVPVEKVEQPAIKTNEIVNVENRSETIKPIEFVLLRELAVEKLKEKLLDKNTIVEQKHGKRLKKISGWDIAQIITKGISKFTGRKMEVKPYYNNEGSLTAYAVSAGQFQFSRGR